MIGLWLSHTKKKVSSSGCNISRRSTLAPQLIRTKYLNCKQKKKKKKQLSSLSLKVPGNTENWKHVYKTSKALIIAKTCIYFLIFDVSEAEIFLRQNTRRRVVGHPIPAPLYLKLWANFIWLSQHFSTFFRGDVKNLTSLLLVS